MNERIKELLQEAYTHFGEGKYFTQELLAEKFAELIIRECGIALHPMLRDMISRGQAYELIKEHFGVE